jgi:cobaltochelatase CobN
LLEYVRRNIDGKQLFSNEPAEPVVIPSDAFFHVGEEAFFPDLASFESHRNKNGLAKPGNPRVALVTSIFGPRSANRAYVDELIGRLENQGINVYPIAGFMKRLDYLKEVDPALVIYVPHGRLAAGRADECVKWLSDRGIPLICPIDVFENHEEWVASQKGMQGGMMTQNILMPELDGGIEPFAISAQFPNDRGLNVPKALPERMDKLVARVDHWLKLKEKPNSEKKVAIVYFKGPGQNAMVASGLEVGASLLNLLKSMKEAGYVTGELPENAKAMEEEIRRRGPVLGPYAKGEIESFVKTGSPEFIKASDLEAWAKKRLDPKMYDAVVKQYGPPPGDYLGIERDGAKGIALPRLQFGNIVVLPQSLPAIGEDTERLVHGAKLAPPHSYLATYLWARYGFQADALIHFGTHGSLEFTPWKQNALSDLDWPDALIGDLPHLYVYVINNIGEAVIAKRRSYATILSHLTPPMTESGLYGPLKNLQDTIGRYDSTTDEALKVELEKSIRKLVLETNLQKDLKLELADAKPLDEDQIESVHDYLHSVADEKITRGLYVLGRPYADVEAEETARLMSQDAVAVGEARKRIDAGKESEKALDDASAFEKNYREPARKAIGAILAGRSKPAEFTDPVDAGRILAWDTAHPTISDDALFARFVSLGSTSGGKPRRPENAGKSGGHPGNVPKQNASSEKLELQFLAVADDPKNIAFLDTLRNDADWTRVRQALDPETMRKARRIAAFVPAMRDALDRMEKPGMADLLIAMKVPENRQKVLFWIGDTEMQTRIREKAQERNRKIMARLQEDEFVDSVTKAAMNGDFAAVAKSMSNESLAELEGNLRFAIENASFSPEITESEGNDAIRRILTTEASEGRLAKTLNITKSEMLRREEAERQVVNQLRALKTAYESATDYRQRILGSTSAEMQAVLGALNGRYVAPSSGGDAVTNPDAVPTGRNLYPIDAEKTPSPEAWTLGQKLAERTIAAKRAESGTEPVKVAVTLWPGEFINSQGVDIAMIFHFLGVEPIRDARGVVHDVRLVPIERLGRPRIDVVVQTAGQFRDIAATRMSLIDRAIKLASQAADSGELPNHVREGTIAAEAKLKELGLSPADARKFSTARIFGGVNGNYGTGIMGLVESGDRWNDRTEIAETYMNNMGAIYTEDHWGEFVPGLFAAAVQNTDTLVHSRTSNVTGPLKLDHVYEFMGGFSNVIASVTGKDPASYFIDMRNRHQSKVQNAEEAIWQEARSTLLNPKYIEELKQEGASAAETFAESVRNTYGWNAMRPDAIDDELWNELHDVYVKDKYAMGMESYFRDKNPFALQEMTAVMLETARKGMWDASPERLSELASLHVALIRDHKPGCSGFVCDNAKLQEFVGQRLPDSERSAYTNAIESVRRSNSETGDSVKGLALEKQSAGKSRQQEKTFSPSNSSSKKEDLPRQDTNRDEIPVVWLAAGFLALATTTALLIIRSRHA